MASKKRSEALGYILISLGVGILIFVVVLTWLFMNGTLELPKIATTGITDPNYTQLISLILVIAMLTITAFIGSFFVRTGSDHVMEGSE
jgi:hypothetical protein